MSDGSLSRRLATLVVDILKKRGHILVVKGGTEALVREIDELMTGTLVPLLPRLLPGPITGEVTSTFADEDADEQVEEMVGTLADALMDSDHVEDVFAEDRVIRRDVFRTIRDELLFGIRPEEVDAEIEDESGPISVRLATLGYVAATASKLADEVTLRDALERAGLSAESELVEYDAGKGEATFASSGEDPERRLEIEEAVADELTDLVEMGLVDLPTDVRRVPFVRRLSADELTVLRPEIVDVGRRVLSVLGCPVALELGADAVSVKLTPMSESDAQGIDGVVAKLERELGTLLSSKVAPTPAASTKVTSTSPSSPAPSSKAPSGQPPSSKAPSSKPAAKKADPKPAAAKKATAKKTAAPKAPSTKAASKKATAKKAPDKASKR